MMRVCKTRDTNVTVFTTKKIFSRIETYLDDKFKYEIILKKDNESLNSFLKRVGKICNEKIDLLFVNTIQMSLLNVPHYIRFNPKSKKILTIHLINHWLIKNFSFNIKNIPRSIDISLCMFLIKKMLLPKYDGINVVYAPIKDFIDKNVSYKKPIFTIPFNFFDEKIKIKTIKKDKKIKFVVPGLVETYRRNYDLTLDIFEKLFQKYNNKISLWILGEPVGLSSRKIIERCKKLKEKGYDISFSESFIPEAKYNKILMDSDVVFSPLNLVTKRESGIKEIYGKTEGSALPFEAIQYVKPLIVPAEFNIDELKTSSLKYKDEKDLEEILINLIKDKNILNKLKKNALINSNKYSLQVLQKYFKDNLLNI
jgi:glycosyltransferase involved in cell wall biosynthesis